jgi:endo-1,4-beta-xylanase
MSGKLTKALLTGWLMMALASGCGGTGNDSGDLPEVSPSTSVWQKYQAYFPVGAAVNATTITTHQELIKNHFNSITAENEMKPDALQPTAGNFNWSRAEAIIRGAKSYNSNMKVRGHTLVWHNQTPGWVFNTNDKEVLLSRMKNHITEVVTHFKNSVYAWDVVNEALSDSSNQNEIYRTTSPWYQITGGPEYITEAFKCAHAADPGAKLFYNDYNIESPTKRAKTITMLQGLLRDGVPIHGVGIQGHWSINNFQATLTNLEQALQAYSALGLEVQITELDISVYLNPSERFTVPPEERLQLQARCYQDLFALFRKYQKIISGVTFWGVADDQTWLDNYPVRGRKDWPLLFDTQHQPKKAFSAMLNF